MMGCLQERMLEFWMGIPEGRDGGPKLVDGAKFGGVRFGGRYVSGALMSVGVPPDQWRGFSGLRWVYLSGLVCLLNGDIPRSGKLWG